MSKVNNNNYFSIHGWMVNELNLQGNELMTYAIVYGFSQTEGTKFTGSINYLCDFTNSSRTTIIKCLKTLTEKKLIIKNQKNINGVVFNEYRANLYLVKNLDLGSQETKQGVVNNLNGGSQESVPNNKDNNKSNNKKEKIPYDEIIGYLNTMACTRYKSTTPKTRALIKARWEEGFKEIDFVTVIKKKCDSWLGTDMEKYLRPETLFGTKFEGYLNERDDFKKGGMVF